MTEIAHIFEAVQRRIQYFARRYRDDRCSDTAAALTYMSLFALVPLLTVLYTMASVIPAFQGVGADIQDLMFEHLVPETSAGLEQYLEDFSRQARNLTGFGVAFLLATAILMLSSIEKAFNHIWRTRGNRGPIPSFLLYWAVLSLAPITIGLGLGVSTYLAALARGLGEYDVIGIGSKLLVISPYLLQAAGFTLIYAAVPNCRVPLRHALIGGLAAAISFNIARALFTWLVAGSSITFIYGAFAAVPLFLLWIYISWNIVLVCAVLVHSLSAYESAARAQRPLLLKALELLHVLWEPQRDGRAVRELALFGRAASLDSESWQRLRDELLRRRVIAQNDGGRYLLARDLDTLPLWQLREWLGSEGEPPEDDPTQPLWERRASTMLRERRESGRTTMAPSVGELFNE
jgi:membrane protein